jgi:oxysterol-binding protein-related protein 9/10/11
MKVVRWWVSSLRGQQYAGRRPEDGVKKPLNAVLGEVFVAHWDAGVDGPAQGDARSQTHLVSEQVSHHPPVTACRVWNDEAGVEAEGFTRQEVTFSGGSINVKQTGYATLTLRQQDEVYLIPLPEVKIKGILTGNPYPELNGHYVIPSTSGWCASVDFSGKGWFGSNDKKHHFEATVYPEGHEKDVAYRVHGNWDTTFEVVNEKTGEVLEKYDMENAPSAEIQTMPLEDMDPYETLRVWGGVREAMIKGDMQGISDAKSKVERGQRSMRKDEEKEGRKWECLFYKDAGRDDIAEGLLKKLGKPMLTKQDAMGIWKFDHEAWNAKGEQRPWRDGLRPDNLKDGETSRKSSAASSVERVDSLAAADDPDSRRTSSIHAVAAPHPADTIQPRQSQAGSVDKVHPPIPASTQQQEVDEAKLSSDVKGISLEEKTAVEEMLRDQYSSHASKGKKH